jgi:hypothetical protein
MNTIQQSLRAFYFQGKRKKTSISKDYICPVIQVEGAKVGHQFSCAWSI